MKFETMKRLIQTIFDSAINEANKQRVTDDESLLSYIYHNPSSIKSHMLTKFEQLKQSGTYTSVLQEHGDKIKERLTITDLNYYINEKKDLRIKLMTFFIPIGLLLLFGIYCLIAHT